MLKKFKKSNDGFTIIEVVIVLAIAALILLIVLLAVPALQRNSRNTQRKNDVSIVIGIYSTYLSDNSGAIPASCNITQAVPAPGCWLRQAKFGFYDTTSATAITWTKQAAAAAPPNVPNTNTIKLYNNAKCLAANTTTTVGTLTSTATVASGASSRSMVAMYAIEGNGTTVYTCQES
jgi:prepilin-type N-terminal cleavage/methylation domain-containing protein